MELFLASFSVFIETKQETTKYTLSQVPKTFRTWIEIQSKEREKLTSDKTSQQLFSIGGHSRAYTL